VAVRATPCSVEHGFDLGTMTFGVLGKPWKAGQLAFSSGAILDCGGGIVTDLDARDHEIFSARKVDALRENGMIVYLQRDFEYLLKRTRHDANRPSLSDSISVVEIMERRDPLYREAADLVLECNGSSKRELSERILDWYQEMSVTESR